MSDSPPVFRIEDDEPQPKRGPGRPRKDANSSAPAPKPTATALNADVRKAMATLDSGYNLVATGLTLFGLTESAKDWINSAEQLKATNEDALKASPKLAKAIANAGSTGGAATFLLTHGMAFASLFSVLRAEIADKRADAILKEHPVPDDPTAF